MTNQEKYADILEAIQKQYPNTPLNYLFGISKQTEQPVSCFTMDCQDCLWNDQNCHSAANEWLTAPVDTAQTNNTNETKEREQMKKKYEIDFEGNVYRLLMSEEQAKVFHFLHDEGWEVTIDEFEDDFQEL